MPQQRSISSLPTGPVDDGVYAEIAGYGRVRFKPGTTPEQVDAAVKAFLEQQRQAKATAEGDAKPFMVRSRTGQMYPSGTVGEAKAGVRAQNEFAREAAWAAPTVAAGLATGGMGFLPAMGTMALTGGVTEGTRAAVEGRDIAPAVVGGAVMGAGTEVGARAVSKIPAAMRWAGRKLLLSAADPPYMPADVAEKVADYIQQEGKEVLNRRNTTALAEVAGAPPVNQASMSIGPMPSHASTPAGSWSSTGRSQGASTRYTADVTPEPLPTPEEALTMGTPPTTTITPSVSRAEQGEMTGKELRRMDRDARTGTTVPVAESPEEALARIIREREQEELERRAAAARRTPNPNNPVPTASHVTPGAATVTQPSSTSTIGQPMHFTADTVPISRRAVDFHAAGVNRAGEYKPGYFLGAPVGLIAGPKALSIASHVVGQTGQKLGGLASEELVRQLVLQSLLSATRPNPPVAPMASHTPKR